MSEKRSLEHTRKGGGKVSIKGKVPSRKGYLRSTAEGKLYKRTQDYFNQYHVRRRMRLLMDSDLFKELKTKAATPLGKA